MENKIRQLRAAHRLTQADLADVLDVSRQTIIAIENGKCIPSLELGMKIADYFGVKVEQIFKLGKKKPEKKEEKKEEFDARRHGYR